MPVTGHPPHRSRRARFAHRALALGVWRRSAQPARDGGCEHGVSIAWPSIVTDFATFREISTPHPYRLPTHPNSRLRNPRGKPKRSLHGEKSMTDVILSDQPVIVRNKDGREKSV